jgi:hypothetical protein
MVKLVEFVGKVSVAIREKFKLEWEKIKQICNP